jgi:hypothetical protein
MAKIENRTLPQRVAEILENVTTYPPVGADGRIALKNQQLAIAHALRSGDTSDIEKWVGK